jgi:hypothetical protein
MRHNYIKTRKDDFSMNKILVTSIEHEFIEHPSKKIILEIPANNNNSLIVEIEKNGENVTTNVYAVLK